MDEANRGSGLSSRSRVISRDAPSLKLPEEFNPLEGMPGQQTSKRPRAGTMPSLMNPDLSAGSDLRRQLSGISLSALRSRSTPGEETPPVQPGGLLGGSSSLLAPSGSAALRLRSGSLTLPTNGLGNAFGPSIFSNRAWTPTDNGGLPSPSIPEETRSMASDDDTGQDAVGTMDYLAGLIGTPLVSPTATAMSGPSIDAHVHGLQTKTASDSPGRLRANTVATFARNNREVAATITAPLAEARAGSSLLSSQDALTAALRPRAVTIGPFQPEEVVPRAPGAPLPAPTITSPPDNNATSTTSYAMSSTSSQDDVHGNLEVRIREAELLQIFAPYGSIESIRVLPEKECAFINFAHLQSAIHARDDIMTRLGGEITQTQGPPVRIGFARPDTTVLHPPPMAPPPSAPVENQNMPSRALWIGSVAALPMPTPSQFLQVFSQWGTVESVRVLTQKSCAFVNFERLEDAVRARKILNGRDIFGPECGPYKIGFARAPMSLAPSGVIEPLLAPQVASTVSMPPSTPAKVYNEQASSVFTPDTVSHDFRSASGSHASIPDGGLGILPPLLATAMPTAAEMQSMMKDLSPLDESLEADVAAIERFAAPAYYYSQIPSPPGWTSTQGLSGLDHGLSARSRAIDIARLREIRKMLDAGGLSRDEVDLMVQELLKDSAALSSDYLGNTIIQKIFELCSSASRMALLEQIAPHIASIGIHKNGTWAAQKIIELSTSPQEIAIICRYLQPFIPPLLLDQFGNYVVGGTLKFGSPASDMVFDAMFNRCWDIGQGRFGARGMRTCLESSHTPRLQQKRVAVAIIYNAIALSTNANGALLLTWLLESSGFPGRYRLIAPRLVAQIPSLCLHKLASTTLLRVINQDVDAEAARMVIDAVFESPPEVLEEILGDQVNGVSFVQRVLASPFVALHQRRLCIEHVERVLRKLGLEQVPAYSGLLHHGAGSTTSSSPALSHASTPLQPGRGPRQASPLTAGARGSPTVLNGPAGWPSPPPTFFPAYSSPYVPVGTPPLSSLPGTPQLGRQPDIYQSMPYYTRPPAEMIPPQLINSPGHYGRMVPGVTSAVGAQNYYEDPNAMYGMPCASHLAVQSRSISSRQQTRCSDRT